jgi:ataxia telangiectasia mutated family protein
VEVHAALLSSKIHRAQSALQESLSLATAMIDLIKPCREVDIHAEVAIHVEAANSLWDQGEMASSIGMLQGLDNGALLKDQTIPIGRSDLLSKIGHQVSIARLEKADKIIEKYLKPALKELKGKVTGSEASQVFYQFAIFCDQQLQDPDSLEDLERLTKLRKNKAMEVLEYDKLISTASSSTDKNKYKNLQIKAKTWLKLDDEELERHNRSRDEFLRQCLENYLLALTASDDYDGAALRFSALWLQNSEDQLANDAVAKHLRTVPSRKFASLMNQLSSRLQNVNVDFQKLLFSLVQRICKDHPLHGMYQIYAGTMSRINEKDESAVSRREATKKISQSFASIESTGQIWGSIYAMNRSYCSLASEKDEQKYRAGKKILLKESRAASQLNQAMSKYKVPPPTMQIPLFANCDYSKLPVMQRLESQFSIASGVSAPKIITVVATNGVKFKQLVSLILPELHTNANGI